MTQISLKLPSLNGSSSCGLASLLRRYPRVLPVLVVVLLFLVGLTVVWVSYTPPGSAGRKREYYTDIGSHNYGVVIDAGSSGSKVQLFHWPPHDGDPTRLLKIKPLVDKMGDTLVTRVHPGISTFASHPEKAFDSLRPLLDYAILHIPRSKHSETSLYILCTAGMRLLPLEEQERITSLLYRAIPATYPFHLPQDGIEVIPGKLEGVFSWITINYLLGHFEPETHQHSSASGGNSAPLGVNTAGSLDMGGASLQIAFEIPPDVEAPSANTVDINLGCGIDNHHKHRVYVNTYLGYGTNEARRRYHRLLRQQHLTSGSSSNKNHSAHSALVRDPCSPLNMQENITVGRHILRVRGLGDFSACKTALAPILLNSSLAAATPLPDSTCSGTSCKISEFQKPSQKYDSLEFYGTSEFWYTMRDVLRIGGKYRAASFESAAKDYCRTEWRILQDRFQKKLYPYADSFRLKAQCVKSAWMSLVLHEGFGFPEEHTALHSTASINGRSVQWSLGALLYHTRYLPLREIQLQQMHKTTSSIGITTNNIFTTLTESSFTLPFLVVISVAVLLLLCRQRRPRYYTLSRNASHVSLGRNTSHMSLSTSHLSLGRNQSSSRLSAIAATPGSSSTSFYLKGAG